MGNTVPSVEMQGLLTTPDNSLRCKWLEGSVLVDSDLVRCDASKAICTFIFCDKTATSSEDVYAEVSTMSPAHLNTPHLATHSCLTTVMHAPQTRAREKKACPHIRIPCRDRV
jgi:hypothetical protein